MRPLYGRAIVCFKIFSPKSFKIVVGGSPLRARNGGTGPTGWGGDKQSTERAQSKFLKEYYGSQSHNHQLELIQV